MSQGADPLKRPLILVADDEPTIRQLVREALECADFSVTEAKNGAQAVAAFSSLQPDLVLLDVMMPEMDGFAVCEALRAAERTREIPIILLTAKDDMETRVLGMKLGVSEFLTKPINKRELFTRIRAQLHQRGLEHGIVSLVDRVD